MTKKEKREIYLEMLRCIFFIVLFTLISLLALKGPKLIHRFMKQEASPTFNVNDESREISVASI